MHDIQSETDHRGIELDEVGITGLRYPVEFDDGQTTQAGIAEIEVTVRLAENVRGTHMSRMVEIAHDVVFHYLTESLMHRFAEART